MGDTPVIRKHLGKRWYRPGDNTLSIVCSAGDHETGFLPPHQAMLAHRQHRKDMGDTVAPLRIKTTFHVGDDVLVPLGPHGHAEGVISQLTMTRLSATAHVLTRLGDSVPSLREYPLADLELATCPHKGMTNGLFVTKVIP